jgi:hypothetical protein
VACKSGDGIGHWVRAAFGSVAVQIIEKPNQSLVAPDTRGLTFPEKLRVSALIFSGDRRI